MVKGRRYITTRAVYKAVKKYDHQDFDEFCTRIYLNGYEDGKKAVQGVDIEEMMKAVSSVKGVGPALAGKIRAAANDLFHESGTENTNIKGKERQEREEETKK